MWRRGSSGCRQNRKKSVRFIKNSLRISCGFVQKCCRYIVQKRCRCDSKLFYLFWKKGDLNTIRDWFTLSRNGNTNPHKTKTTNIKPEKKRKEERRNTNKNNKEKLRKSRRIRKARPRDGDGKGGGGGARTTRNGGGGESN